VAVILYIALSKMLQSIQPAAVGSS
jgi:hypothetical protein